MENKLTLLLNDKELIKELVSDEEVKLVLKDKIVKAVVNRLLKGDKSMLSPLENKVSNDIKDYIIKECFYNAWDKRLNDTFKQKIDELITLQISEHINSYKQEMAELLKSKRTEILDRLENAECLEEVRLNQLIKQRIDEKISSKIDILLKINN